MRRPAFLCVFLPCFALACGPAKPTPSKEVNLVNAEELARIYRRNPKDRTFANQLVQCQLEPRSYRVRPGVIEAVYFADHLPGCVVFECPSPPADTSKRLIVTGRCVGIIRDGIQREATTDFYVRVEGTSVTVLEP